MKEINLINSHQISCLLVASVPASNLTLGDQLMLLATCWIV